MTYLDWAATAVPDSGLLIEAAELALAFPGNPSSSHAAGKAAKARLEEARHRLVGALGAGAAEGSLIFAGSGSEADAIPLLALINKARRDGTRPHVVASSIEHPAIHEQLQNLGKLGIDLTWVDPGPDGLIEPRRIALALRPETALCCVMAVNNETGAIQPIAGIIGAVKDVAAKSHRKRVRVHVDAIQALGKIPFEPAVLEVDFTAFSAHKIRGPKGVGALWLSEAVARAFEPLAAGGGQEGGLRPGTESLQGAWAFSRAAATAVTGLASGLATAGAHEARLIEGLLTIGAIPLPLGRRPGDPRFSPYILSVTFPGLSGEVLARALDSYGDAGGIAVSTGSACSSNARKKGRPVLEAMGLDGNLALGAIRVSTGSLTTDDDIGIFLEAVAVLHPRLRA
ncbi:MAG: aminotransferase class V-fold PLP-dependent enzyme [Spirochaetota bacterium]